MLSLGVRRRLLALDAVSANNVADLFNASVSIAKCVFFPDGAVEAVKVAIQMPVAYLVAQ